LGGLISAGKMQLISQCQQQSPREDESKGRVRVPVGCCGDVACALKCFATWWVTCKRTDVLLGDGLCLRSAQIAAQLLKQRSTTPADPRLLTSLANCTRRAFQHCELTNIIPRTEKTGSPSSSTPPPLITRPAHHPSLGHTIPLHLSTQQQSEHHTSPQT
jgi:hypothetical protein